MEHPILTVLLSFTILYYVGTHVAYRERVIARRRIPKSIKRILFINRASVSRFTLNTIIYQGLLVLTTAIVLGICFFAPSAEVETICALHIIWMYALFLFEAIFAVRLGLIEQKNYFM